MPSKKKSYIKKSRSKGDYAKKSKNASEATKNHILKVIYSAGGRWLTVNEIAKKAGISWVTTKIYLNELFHEGYLQTGETKGGLICWKENE